MICFELRYQFLLNNRLQELANTLGQIREIGTNGDLDVNEKALPRCTSPNQLKDQLLSPHQNTHLQSQHRKR